MGCGPRKRVALDIGVLAEELQLSPELLRINRPEVGKGNRGHVRVPQLVPCSDY